MATFISNPAARALDEALLVRIAKDLPAADAPRWLAAVVAADLFFTPGDKIESKMLAEELRSKVDRRPIDVVVQPAERRRKRLLVADMESTMIGQECLDELADKVGLKQQIATITERAMRGEIAFEPALRERLALLRGLPRSIVDQVLCERVTLNPGAVELVRTMRADGAYTCLVSGGFTFFTEPIAAMIGFDEHRANRLVIRDDRIEGVEEPILGRDAKLNALLEIAAKLGLEPADAIAVGDGANDIAMLQAAGLGVAYRAKPRVAAAAHARIDHADLTALLYIQGYSRDEFVEN